MCITYGILVVQKQKYISCTETTKKRLSCTERKVSIMLSFEELKKAITDLVATPESAQTLAVDLIKQLEEDYSTIEAMQAKSAEDAEKIRSLQDTNQKLFLMQTGQSPVEEDEELEGTDAVDAFIKELATKE